MIANRRDRKNGHIWEKTTDVDETIEEDQKELISLMDDDEYEDFYKEKLGNISDKLSEALLNTEDNYIDVRAINLMQKQISVMAKAADNGSFEVPIEIDGVKVSMHVTLREDDSNKSRMDASVQTDEYGLLTASLYEEDGEIRGMLTTSFAGDENESAYLEMVRDKLCKALADKIKDLGVDQKKIGILYHAKAPSGIGTVNNKVTEGKKAPKTDTGTLLIMAKAFIEAL